MEIMKSMLNEIFSIDFIDNSISVRVYLRLD